MSSFKYYIVSLLFAYSFIFSLSAAERGGGERGGDFGNFDAGDRANVNPAERNTMNSNRLYSGSNTNPAAVDTMNSNRIYSGSNTNPAAVDSMNSNRLYNGSNTNPAAVDRMNANNLYSGNPSNYNANYRGTNPYYNANLYTGAMGGYGGGYYGYNGGYSSQPYAYPYYGYGGVPIETNAQAFPDDAAANSLYWNEVRQAESGR